MATKKTEPLQIAASPGAKINLSNHTKVTKRYRIEFGEYGSVTFDSIVGSTAIITCGEKAPEIHVLETDYVSGVKALE